MDFEQKEWVAGVDDLPGANDMNRIEQGISDAHQKLQDLPSNLDGEIIGRIKLIERLDAGAKVADVGLKLNELIDAIVGALATDDADAE